MTMKTFHGRIQFARRAMVWLAFATSVIRSVAAQSVTNQRPPVRDRQKRHRACAQCLSAIGCKQGGGLRS